MKHKIVGIFICMLLISSTTTLALTPFSKDEQQMKHQFFDTTPVPLPTPKMFNKTFGGAFHDSGNFVQQTTDGGYIITGRTYSFGAGDSDVWLIKTDRNGYEEWNKTFGGKEEDAGRFVQQTINGGYIIIGSTNSLDTGNQVIWLIKTNDNGEKIWDKTFRGAVLDFGDSGQQTADGGYIITGGADSFSALNIDVLLIKTDSNGDEVWNKTFGGSSNDFGFSVQQTNDSGYIIIGWTLSDLNRSVDILLIKTDENGNKMWEKTFGGTEWDSSESIQQTTDGGYIVTGQTASIGSGGDDVWLIKTDKNGNEEWNRTFGGKSQDLGKSVKQTTDGGYIITGFTLSFDVGDGDVWLIKTDSQGKSKTTSVGNLWFERLFQRFPNAFPILRQLFGY